MVLGGDRPRMLGTLAAVVFACALWWWFGKEAGEEEREGSAPEAKDDTIDAVSLYGMFAWC